MLLNFIGLAYWILILVALPMSVGTIFISVPIAALIFFGYAQIRKRKVGLPKGFLSFLLAASLFPVAEALIGAAAYDTQSVVASNVGLVLFGLSILFTVVATAREKGRRLFVFGTGCVFIHWTFWTWFLAQMPIANSWI